MKKNSLFLFTSLSFFAFSSTLNAQIIEKKDSYSDVGAIPYVLLKKLEADRPLESYIEQNLFKIRKNSASRFELTETDIESRKKENLRKSQIEKLKKLASYDLNWDSIVTKEEIQESLKSKKGDEFIDGIGHLYYPEDIAVLVEKALSSDSNKDNKINYQEMTQLKAIDIADIESSKDILDLEDLYDLDPNKDGKLTTAELEDLSRKAFATIDKDSNGDFSRSEWESVRQQLQKLKRKGENERRKAVPEICNFELAKLPADTIVYSAGGYSGKKKDGSKEKRLNDEIITEQSIVINETSPVALILSAKAGTEWNISHTPNTKIAAAFLSGDKEQKISGLDKTIPILISTNENKGNCGEQLYQRGDLQGLNPLSRKLFNRPVAMFYPLEEGKEIVMGNVQYNPEELIGYKKVTRHKTSEESKEKEISLEKTPKDLRKIELEEAISKKILRRAHHEDSKIWKEAVVERIKKDGDKKFDLPPTAGGDSISDSIPQHSMDEAYIVLSNYSYPTGITKEDDLKFIISKGVKLEGDPGQATTFDLNTGMCTGPKCHTY